jgi:predicted transcriptional regulator
MSKRMTATSLLANARTDKPTKRALIFRYLHENKQANYKEIATALHIQINTVTGRINEMLYKHQEIRVCGIVDNMHVYCVRLETDPENKRPLSDAEIWQKVAEEYCLGLLNFEDNNLYNEAEAKTVAKQRFNDIKKAAV